MFDTYLVYFPILSPNQEQIVDLFVEIEWYTTTCTKDKQCPRDQCDILEKGKPEINFM